MDECHLRMNEYNSTIMDVFIHSYLSTFIHVRVHVLYIRSSEQWMLKSQAFDWVEASFLFVKAEHL
jgi:hypothetical protein